MKLFDLSGEVAVVIGATGELGGALAEGLGEAGAKVAVLGRNAERGQIRVKNIQAKGGQAAFFSADAIKKESLHAAHLAIEKALGAPTILVNAAGGNDPKVTVTADRSFEQIALADWQANFDLNLVGGVLLPCQEFGPGMAARGKGSIINIASVSAHLPLSTPLRPAFSPPNKTASCCSTTTVPQPPAPKPFGATRRWAVSASPTNSSARHYSSPARRPAALSPGRTFVWMEGFWRRQSSFYP